MDNKDVKPVVYTATSGKQADEDTPEKKESKQFYLMAAFLSIILVFVGIGSYILFQPKEQTTNMTVQQTQQTPTTIPSPTEPFSIIRKPARLAGEHDPTITPDPTISNR